MSPAYVEISYEDLILGEHFPEIQTGTWIPGCRPEDLVSFHWKEVDSGLVDIRTPEEYAIQTESLFQEGYLGYQQALVEYPDISLSIPEMTYEVFLATCNVFPDVDFSQNSILGYQATGAGCAVDFDKHVYRDDQNKRILYKLAVIEEGTCETVFHDRNLVLVPRIPSDYKVTFLLSERQG